MPQPRIPLEPGQVYHIWTHANGSENLFRSEENYRYFLEKYSLYVHPVGETFAYCLMPNHLHLMVRVRAEEEVLAFLRLKKPTLQGFTTLGGFSKAISLQFSHLFNGYTQAYNKQFNRKGSLFISKFNRKYINTEAYFTRLIAYIHNNPIHHGFVKYLNDWPHSSWHAYLLNKNTKINKEEGLEWFGGKEAFEALHLELQQEKLVSLFEE
jgi:REP element-mobilizing transposase RayT